MAQLDDAQKRFIVRRLAAFASQKTVRAEFEKEFGFALSEDQVSGYDAKTVHGQERMGQELQDLFKKERDRYIKDAESAPLNFLNVRQNERLDILQNDPMVARSPKMKLQIIQEAAKDAGGLFERAPAASTRTGAPPAEGVEGSGGDDNDAAAKRDGAFARLLGTARTRRVRATAATRRTGPPAPPAE